MKKAIAIILLALMVLTLSGCTKEATKPTTTPTTPESTELDKDIENIETVSEEINTSDLEGLEQDLENVNW
ncbi:MAG: hypothetical protein QW404_02760 [Candidatus Nanoarchaeia archaeon]